MIKRLVGCLFFRITLVCIQNIHNTYYIVKNIGLDMIICLILLGEVDFIDH